MRLLGEGESDKKKKKLVSLSVWVVYFHLIVLVQYLWNLFSLSLSCKNYLCPLCVLVYFFVTLPLAGGIELIFRYAFVACRIRGIIPTIAIPSFFTSWLVIDREEMLSTPFYSIELALMIQASSNMGI